MDTDALRWFQQVADGVTLTEVADLFGVSQPGVSRAIGRLQADVGTPLLTRTGRLLQPTHAGTIFKRHVDAVLHHLDDGLAAVEELVEPETGTVTLGFSPSFGAWLVPRLISGFRLEHPQVRFRLENSEDVADPASISRGTVDLQITADRSSDPSVHWERLFTQPFLLSVPPGHRLSGRGEVSLADAAQDAFVMLRPSWGLRRLTEEICGAAGFTPRVALEGHDLSGVRGLVAAGLGVAVIPAPGIDLSPDPTEHLLRLTESAASREVGLAWSRTRRLLPSAELVRRYTIEAMRNGSAARGLP